MVKGSQGGVVRLHLSRIPGTQRLLTLAGLALAVAAAMTLWLYAVGSDDQVVTAGAKYGGEITSREDAALRGVEFARKRDGIEAKEVFVGETTRAQFARSQGGELGETIPDRDAPVWVVVIEPTRPIVKTDKGRTSTFVLFEVAFNKATGRGVGSSYYYEGVQPAISTSPTTRVELPAR